MQLFYTPNIQENIHTLPEDESKHIIRVLRMTIGDTFYLTDGCGNLHTAKIIADHAKRCTVEITNTAKQYQKRSTHLHIAIAPTKNIDRYEWFLEKATEIGIDTITPLICHHSERKKTKHERSLKVLIAAMKQSLKAYLPQLNADTPFTQIINVPFNGAKYIAYVDFENPEQLKKHLPKDQDTLILIGPEGDFSETEVALAEQNGFKKIGLGPYRLRTETAALAACHTFNLTNY